MLAEKTIKKHVAIIHAYSLMSTLQRKIINVLLYEASRQREYHNPNSVAVECRIPFSNVSKNINFNSHNTQYLKEAIDALASLKIEWNLLKDKVPTQISFVNLRVLHGPPTFYQDGSFNFSFHKLILDLVNSPMVYGTIDLAIQSKFESKYAHSLYENSTRFVNLVKNKVIPLDVFRKLLGVPETSYLSMREFNRNVIVNSLEEVNDQANFEVKLIGIKSGRKIIAYEVEVKNKLQKLKDQQQETSCFLSTMLKSLFPNIQSHSMDYILKQYSEEYIHTKVEYVKKFAKKDKDGLYPLPYFISALKNNYQANDKKTIESPKLSSDQVWNDQLQKLVLDLNHWKRRHSYLQSTQKLDQITNVEKVIQSCEDKIVAHYLLKPVEVIA